MPYAHHRGVRIFYEVEGAGPPLVLAHGSVCSHVEWRELGYTDALRRDFRLILIDARGHGASDRPHDPAAYALPLRVADVLVVLDALAIGRAHYIGYSMGAWIGFGLATYAPERVGTLILGGAHPFAESFQARRVMLAQGRDAFMAASERAFGAYMTPARRARLLTTDLEAQLAQAQDREDMSDVLPTMRMPCLLFAGEREPRLSHIQECVRQLPDGALFVVPGCDHIGAWARSAAVLPQLSAFLARASGASAERCV